MKKIFVILFLFIFFFSATGVSADYSTFRYDFKRSGQSAFSITDNLVKVFTSPNVGSIQNQPAIDADGNIYASIWNGGLKVFNKDGQNIWSSGTTEPSGTPAFDNEGNLYFCADTSNPKVYSFTKSGQKRWEYSLRPPGSYYSNPCMSSPAMSPNKDTLYITTDWPTQTILAFNLDGTVKWESRISYTPSSASIAVADDGTLYVGTNGNGALISLTSNGTINWTRFSGTVFKTPLIGSDGNIYVTNFRWNGTAIMSYTPSGQLRWSYPGTPNLASELAFKDNTVYAVADNKILAINSINGILKWTWQAPITTTLISSPSVDSNGVIFVSMKDTLYSIDSTGIEKWELPVANNLSIPIIFDNNKILLYNRISGYVGNFYILGTPTPTPPAKTPVVFIPGIGGSEFKSNQTFFSNIKECGIDTPFIYGNNDTVWVNKTIAGISLCDDYFDVLKLQSDGQTPTYPQIVLNGEIFQDSYGDTLDFFKENGYELNKTLFIFPYDWRKDITLTAPLLDQKINEIKQQTGSQKVDLVAHSMGGLVAKNYIKDPAQAGKVRKLITLGTPYLGSVKLLKALRYGDYFGRSLLLGLVALNPDEIKDVVQNFSGAFELLPSRSYYEFYDGTNSDYLTPFRDDNDIDKNGVKGSLNYVQLQQLLNYFNHNMNLFNSADNFHNQLDKIWQNGINNVNTTLIVGSGEPTLIQINEQNKIKFSFDIDTGLQINKREEILANGDGTVPLYSASLIDATRNLNFGGSAKVYFTSQGHGNLVNKNSGPALQLTLNILENKTDIPAGVQTSPYKLTGKEVLVQSPVELHIYDSQNRHTGPIINGDFENNIPGSVYSTLGTTKSIWLPENGQYTFKLLATDNGDFDLKIRSFENDVNTQTIIYKDVPILNTTKIEADYNTALTPPMLEIDQDGNGTSDKQIEASALLTGDQNNDQASPTTTINLNGQKGNNSWYISDVTVELLANDQDSGSGILKTVYTLDGGQTTQEYSSPFIISSEGINKLQVKSIDRAGNEEFPVKTAEIKIDKTNPVVNISADPKNIWSPNKKMVDVKISGDSSDNTSGVSFKMFTFEDEYKTLSPTISDFNQTVKLEAWRDGNDKDGRIYTVKVLVEDQAGNKSEANTDITAPHDQR